jgi:cytochrome b involved in lipid metabolism
MSCFANIEDLQLCTCEQSLTHPLCDSSHELLAAAGASHAGPVSLRQLTVTADLTTHEVLLIHRAARRAARDPDRSALIDARRRDVERLRASKLAAVPDQGSGKPDALRLAHAVAAADNTSGNDDDVADGDDVAGDDDECQDPLCDRPRSRSRAASSRASSSQASEAGGASRRDRQRASNRDAHRRRATHVSRRGDVDVLVDEQFVEPARAAAPPRSLSPDIEDTVEDPAAVQQRAASSEGIVTPVVSLSRLRKRDLRPVRRAELAEHKTRASCWVTIGAYVYDVTDYLDKHKAGADSILKYAGEDISYHVQFHSKMMMKLLKQHYLIGKLVPEPHEKSGAGCTVQ